MSDFQTAYQNAIKGAIETFMEETAESISFEAIQGNMRQAAASENPLARPKDNPDPRIRILHPSHTGIYTLQTAQGEIEVDIQAGRLKESLDYEAGGSPTEEMVLRKEVGDGMSTLEFGTSVDYAWQEDIFHFLEDAFEEVKPGMPTVLAWNFDRKFEDISVYQEVKLTIRV